MDKVETQMQNGQPATLVEQLLEGARDQLRNGDVVAAVALLENTIDLVEDNREAAGAGTAALLRDVSSLVESGARFWAGWAQLISPDAGLYTATGSFVPAPVSLPSRVTIRG